MSSINSDVRGLHLKGKTVVIRMKKVSLSIVVYLIWKERNIRVFENSCSLVETIFRRFQVLFHMILHFHEHNHLITNVSWLVWWLWALLWKDVFLGLVPAWCVASASFCYWYFFYGFIAILHAVSFPWCVLISNWSFAPVVSHDVLLPCFCFVLSWEPCNIRFLS
jgi:hypothetical protein